MALCPDWWGSIGWASFHKVKGNRFDSQLGHIPGLKVWCPVRACTRANQCFSLTWMFFFFYFSPPSPINKQPKKLITLDPNKHFSKNDIEMVSWHMKRCLTSLIITKCKLKPQWDITSHLSEWLSPINQQKVLVRIQRKWEACELLMVLQTGAVIMQSSTEVSHKIKHWTTV